MLEPLIAIIALSAGVVTCRVVWGVWVDRGRITCMTGMMVAMAVGMMTGLVAGLGAAALLGQDLWLSTLLGMATGAALGIIVGKAVSLMAMLDGSLSGLMGGMMGAMLGVMAPMAVPVALLVLSVIYLATVTALSAMLEEETGHELPQMRRTVLVAGVLMVAVFAAFRPDANGVWSLFSAQTADSREHQGHTPFGSEPVGRLPAEPMQIEITASDFAFDRRELTLAAGRPVRLILRNTGQEEHDFVVQDLTAMVTRTGKHGTGLHAHAIGGQEDAIEFIPQSPGLYQAFCSIPGHREAGMKVALRVVES